MGIGSSRERYEPRSIRQSVVPQYGNQGKKRRRRSILRRIRPTPSIQPVMPILYRSPRRYPYNIRPYIPPISPYAPVYPQYMPMSYNNYAAPSYISPRQPMMIPPQQFQPIVMPQSQPMMMPQPMIIPQQVPQPRPMSMPQQVSPPMYSPYISSPYSMGVPLSTPYMQQQPQVQPVYNNIGVSAPVSTGMNGPLGPYSSSYPATAIKLSTDWTGGGQISPGFLGPPI